jgi:hypothetical protein
MKLPSYDATARAHGKKWADRCKIEEAGVPMPVRTQDRGCPECAEYGWPGWVTDGSTWKKCECWKDGQPRERWPNLKTESK